MFGEKPDQVIIRASRRRPAPNREATMLKPPRAVILEAGRTAPIPAWPVLCGEKPSPVTTFVSHREPGIRRRKTIIGERLETPARKRMSLTSF